MAGRDEQAVVVLPLSALDAHPQNCNAMPAEAYVKLKAHLAEHGRYPPVIVRRKVGVVRGEHMESAGGTEFPGEPQPSARYELLDGHHRVRALRELGRETACCVVWDVDDGEAGVLLATLNRLRGRDDPRKRAALLASLSKRFPKKELLGRLPESPEKLKRFLTLDREAGPRLRAPEPLEALPVAVHFFLLPGQKRRLDAVLRRRGGTREEALMGLVEAAETTGPRP